MFQSPVQPSVCEACSFERIHLLSPEIFLRRTSELFTVNLFTFYFYKLIGKLTDFLQLQDFSFRNLPVDSSTTTARRSPHFSNPKWVTRPHQGFRFTYQLKYWWVTYSFSITHSPITLAILRGSSINLVSIFRCSSPPYNPVYTRRVDPSTLV